jgi:hypothetical protein
MSNQKRPAALWPRPATTNPVPEAGEQKQWHASRRGPAPEPVFDFSRGGRYNAPRCIFSKPFDLWL